MSVEEIDVSNTIKIIKFVANESLIGRKISQIELEFSNLKYTYRLIVCGVTS